jgi:hypothetical protein
VASLQQPDGSFTGDQWGEVDTRFSYCALLCLGIIGRDAAIDVGAAVHYIAQCKNFDGGFGCTPGVGGLRACDGTVVDGSEACMQPKVGCMMLEYLMLVARCLAYSALLSYKAAPLLFCSYT